MPSGHVFSRSWLTKRLPNATSRKNLRPDIQGLRMLAVVAVILDHLLHWPTGGFVGVDVFFVISGFLITGILLREHEKTGHISFVGFYKRRIKRIIPAATIVLVATVIAAQFAFNQARAGQTFWDAVWSFFFAGNWRFAAAGTDYFQSDGPVSPLQHFWSLSVEEQFYFVWPWLMLGVLAIAGARGTLVRRRTLTGIVMAVIVVATFAWSIYETSTNPTVAYFSTFSRTWELGVGALIAIASPWWSHIAHSLRPVLGWVGLLGILASYFIINDSMPFPAPWALLPVLATALVIVAGTGGEQRFLFPLTNPVSFYIGNISYSLYLWHFPIVIIGAVLMPDPVVYYVVSIALMLALSALSYHLVEVPVQRSPILERFQGSSKRTKRDRRRNAWRQWRVDYRDTYRYGSLATVTVIAMILGGLLYAREASIIEANEARIAASQDAEQAADGATPAPEATEQFGPEVATIQNALSNAIQTSSWPSLNPSMDDVIGGPQVPDDVAACGQVDTLPVDDCSWGGGERTILLVGDSTSLAYTEAFRTAAEAMNARIVTRAMFGCPFVDISISNNAAGVVEACGPHNDETIDIAAELQPDLVVVTDTYEPRTNDQTGQTVTASEWQAGLESYLGRIAPSASSVAVLSPPPSSANVQNCYTPQSSPLDCMSQVGSAWTATSAVERAAAESVGGTYVDGRDLFCVGSRCPAFADGTPVKLDLVHITSAWAQKIAPALVEVMREAGVQV